MFCKVSCVIGKCTNVCGYCRYFSLISLGFKRCINLRFGIVIALLSSPHGVSLLLYGGLAQISPLTDCIQILDNVLLAFYISFKFIDFGILSLVNGCLGSLVHIIVGNLNRIVQFFLLLRC